MAIDLFLSDNLCRHPIHRKKSVNSPRTRKKFLIKISDMLRAAGKDAALDLPSCRKSPGVFTRAHAQHARAHIVINIFNIYYGQPLKGCPMFYLNAIPFCDPATRG